MALSAILSFPLFPFDGPRDKSELKASFESFGPELTDGATRSPAPELGLGGWARRASWDIGAVEGVCVRDGRVDDEDEAPL